jgi:hypothetical protein
MIVLQFHPENAFGGFKDSAFDFKFFFAQVLLREKLESCVYKKTLLLSLVEAASRIMRCRCALYHLKGNDQCTS